MKLLWILLGIVILILLLYILCLRCNRRRDWTKFRGWRYAHRGFHDKPRIPENSIPAFKRAVQCGAGRASDEGRPSGGDPRRLPAAHRRCGRGDRGSDGGGLAAIQAGGHGVPHPPAGGGAAHLRRKGAADRGAEGRAGQRRRPGRRGLQAAGQAPECDLLHGVL